MIFAQVQAATGGGGTLAISAVIAAFCLLTVGCTLALAETSRGDLVGATGPTRTNRSARR
ncbi:hypothetical protein AB0K60_36135 [Thermopolyspora sp. NPDC052614]|uniref:hypothetical protein n=1 Tax=Thermopolyspora sp. NPDC052614 TaxID=3155682 RepID=UPI003413096C